MKKKTTSTIKTEFLRAKSVLLELTYSELEEILPGLDEICGKVCPNLNHDKFME